MTSNELGSLLLLPPVLFSLLWDPVSLYSVPKCSLAYMLGKEKLSVSDLTNQEKKKKPACGMQLLTLLQGLLPARNDSKGLELSPAETPSVPALALGVSIVKGTQ